jgi:outer membrane protein TolC
MKKLIVMLLCGLSVPTFGQTNQTLTLNLQEAIKTGLQNRYDLKAKQYDINLAENKLNKNKKAWIPDIEAEGNIQYNTQNQPTYAPKGFAGLTEAEVISFGAKNASTFGLSLMQPLFKPGIHTDVQLAKTNLALQKEKIQGSRIDIKNNIATAYLNVLLKKLQYNIAENEEKRFETYKNLAEGKYNNGALIRNDYLRAKLDEENAKVNTQTAQQDYKLARVFLKYQMNVPVETQIILTDSIGNISFNALGKNAAQPLENRTEIKQLKLQQQQDGLQIKKMRQNALPTVSLVSYYAQIYQNQDFHYEASKWWAPNSYVGLQFSIPITKNFSNKNNIREFKLQQQQLDLRLQQEESDISYQVQKAAADLENATENMQSAKANYNLSQTIYKNQQQQFTIGVFHYSDLLDTEKSLDKAEQNYTQTVYDFMKAKIAYRKALGEW